MIEMVDEQIVQDNRNEEKTEMEILEILVKIPKEDKETLKRLIEKLTDLQEKHLHRPPERESAYFYWSGKIDVWDKIFQALMGK